MENIISRKVFETIEKYRELTKNHERRFLFDYGKNAPNRMMSRARFNLLLREFIDEKVISNPQYEFAKKTCGIESFEYVTAGDSRPIAMANLFFQGAISDVCRQLANHIRISTSEGYFTNVTETLFCASVIRAQNSINKGFFRREPNENSLIYSDKFGCTSNKHLVNPRNIEDCKEHYGDCYGCPYHAPKEKEVDKHMLECKRTLEECLRKVLALKNALKQKDPRADVELLNLHTKGARFIESTDLYAEKEAEKWVEHQSIPTIFC